MIELLRRIQVYIPYSLAYSTSHDQQQEQGYKPTLSNTGHKAGACFGH